MPARYAAYLAHARPPKAEDAILDEQSGDEDRTFLFPIHKLFNGTECLKGSNVALKFLERHRNEKLSKFHSDPDGAAVPVVDGTRSLFMANYGLDKNRSTQARDALRMGRDFAVMWRYRNRIRASLGREV
jgi:hypothetical protein